MSVQGEIDLYTVPRLQRALAAALAAGGPVRLVVDLSGVDFCDSTGVNVLSPPIARHVRGAGTWDWPRRARRSGRSCR